MKRRVFRRTHTWALSFTKELPPWSDSVAFLSLTELLDNVHLLQTCLRGPILRLAGVAHLKRPEATSFPASARTWPWECWYIHRCRWGRWSLHSLGCPSGSCTNLQNRAPSGCTRLASQKYNLVQEFFCPFSLICLLQYVQLNFCFEFSNPFCWKPNVHYPRMF